MIRRKEDHIRFDKQIAGGPGLAHATQLLNEGEFYDKGRLFNIVRLGPGDAVGRHQHVGDMWRSTTSSRASAAMTTTAPRSCSMPGTRPSVPTANGMPSTTTAPTTWRWSA